MKKNSIVLIILIIFICSCYEQTIIVNQGAQSGIITYRVQYYDEFINLISYISESHDIDINTSILFDKKKLKEFIAVNSVTNLLQHTIKKIGNSKHSEVILSFDEIEKLPKQLPNFYFPTSIYEENRIIYCDTSLTLRNIASPNDIRLIYKTLKENEKLIIDSYAYIIKLKFIYNTPKPIIFANKGKISKGKESLIYETSLYEILNSKEDMEISISYRK